MLRLREPRRQRIASRAAAARLTGMGSRTSRPKTMKHVEPDEAEKTCNRWEPGSKRATSP